MTSRDLLSPADLERAWRLAFTQSLDDLPNSEIAWEARCWRNQGASSIAELCDALLTERRAAGQAIGGGADAADLDKMLGSIDLRAALRLCRDEGLCLLAAARLVFWSGLREMQR